MSTQYGYHCRTCDESSDHWYNRGQAILRKLYEHRDLFVRMLHVLDTEPDLYPFHMNFDLHGYDDHPVHWLKAHRGHEICLRDEYGRKEDL